MAMSLDPKQFSGIVEQWSQIGRAGEPRIEPEARRAYSRRTWFAPVEVMPRAQDDEPNRVYATSTDIGLGGVGILSRTELPQGQTVWLRVPDNSGQGPWVSMRVAHTIQTVGGYRVGLSFENGPEL